MMDGCRDTWEESADYFRGYDDGRFDALKENEYKCADSWRLGYAEGKRDAVRHGEWERVDSITEDGYKWSKWVCSNCGYIRTCGWEYTKEGSKPTALLCEHCGARMDGKEQQDENDNQSGRHRV